MLSRLPFLPALTRDAVVRKIAANAGIILSGNTMASFLNLISFTIMANRCGPQALAVFALAQNYSMILNDIFNVQTWESMVRYGTTERGDRSTISIIKTNLMFDFFSALVATGMAVVLIGPVARYLKWDTSQVGIMLLYTLTILFNLTSLTIGIPRLFNRFSSLAKLQVIAGVVKLCLVGALSFSSSGIERYLIVFALTDSGANVGTIVLSLVLLRRHFGKGWWRERARVNREQLSFLWWTNLRTIMRIPVRHFDMIIISSVMPMAMVGVYRVYKEVAGIILRIGEPVNQAIYPEYTRLISKGKPEEAIGVGRRTITLMMTFSACLALPYMAGSRIFVHYAYGNDYSQWMSALYLLIAFYSVSFAMIPVHSLFLAAGYAKYTFLIVVFTNLIYLATAYSLGSRIGIHGIVMAYFVQTLLNSSLKLIIMKKSRP